MRIIKPKLDSDINLSLTMLKTVQIGGHKIKLTQYIYNRALELGESTVPELYFKVMESLGGNIDLPLIPQVNKTYRSYLSRLMYLLKKGGLYAEYIPEKDNEYAVIMKCLTYCLINDIPYFEAKYRDDTYTFRVLNFRDILKHSYLSFFLVAERLATPQHMEELEEATGLGRGLIETYLKVMRMYRLIHMKSGKYVFKDKEKYIKVREAGEAKKQKVLDKLVRYSRAIKLFNSGYDLRSISKFTGFTVQYLHHLLKGEINGSRILIYAKRLNSEGLLPDEDYIVLKNFLTVSNSKVN